MERITLIQALMARYYDVSIERISHDNYAIDFEIGLFGRVGDFHVAIISDDGGETIVDVSRPTLEGYQGFYGLLCAIGKFARMMDREYKSLTTSNHKLFGIQGN